MKNAIRHITIYLLTTIMLVSSTGFSVCCMFGCHDAKVASGELDCCEKTICEADAEQPVSECPDCNSKYVNLDIDYLLTSTDHKISLPPETIFQPLFNISEIALIVKIIAPLEHDLPPPPYGKELLPLIQSFLC